MDQGWPARLNGIEDEDEAIRIAIAMSLGQTMSPGQRPSAGESLEGPRVVDLTEDEDSTELAETVQSPRIAKQEVVRPAPVDSLAAMGLDRKKMEEERLARLKKRKASSEPADVDQLRPSRRSKVELSAARDAAPARDAAQGRPRADHTAPTPHFPFRRGVVRRTWAKGYSRTGDDVSIEEILRKDELELAVLSSFQWDDDWLLSKVDLARTKLILVAFAENEAQREEMRRNVPPDRIRFCFPPMAGPGSMHSKLQLLKFPSCLRIAVPTGNLVPYDWGETGVMENMVFIIDLPKIEAANSAVQNQRTAFQDDLSYFLERQGMDKKLVQSLQGYDFSETARYAFVHSVAGSHFKDSWRRTGYCGLGRAVAALNLGSSDDIEVDFVAASLGCIRYDLLQAIYNACQGDDGLKEYRGRTSRSKKSKDAAGTDAGHAALSTHFRVYFPSRQTVVGSRGGRGSAGTICFQRRWWEQSSFPRDVLRDYESERRGLLMHSKILYVRRRGAEAPGQPTGFAYVGSANLSESAWGRLVQDRATGEPKLTCRNWECGVVVPGISSLSLSSSSSSSSSPATRFALESKPQDGDWSVSFQGLIPVPMKLPGTPYAPNTAVIPWFYQET